LGPIAAVFDINDTSALGGMAFRKTGNFWSQDTSPTTLLLHSDGTNWQPAVTDAGSTSPGVAIDATKSFLFVVTQTQIIRYRLGP
jgi:hypothetical protein